jgi:hypothetical protein
MRETLLIATLLLLLPISLAQTRQAETSLPTVFDFQTPFEHPVRLPDAVLNKLRSDAGNRQAFKSCQKRRKSKEIPANWFIATQISLKDDAPPALLVRGDNSCLSNGSSGPFWIFRQVGSDYQLVLNDTATNMMLLPMPDEGYRDIECSSELPGVRVVREFKFNSSTYALTSKEVKAGQWFVPS